LPYRDSTSKMCWRIYFVSREAWSLSRISYVICSMSLVLSRINEQNEFENSECGFG